MIYVTRVDSPINTHRWPTAPAEHDNTVVSSAIHVSAALKHTRVIAIN